MVKEHDFLKLFAEERPVGSENNGKSIEMIEACLKEMGYTIQSLPFGCNVWQWGPSAIQMGGERIAAEPSPFSEPFEGSARLCAAKSITDLRNLDCRESILLLSGELTQAPLSPKGYPFYFPDEHKEMIELLEQKRPAAILAATGETSLNGKNPFPLFEDGNFLIPSANISLDAYERMEDLLRAGAVTAELTIQSCKKPSHSRQIVSSKKSKKAKGKIVLAAHMDSKYDTPGALDNAAGVAVLLKAAAELNSTGYDIDVVPFNSEEYYGATGELEYINWIGDEPISLMINIDSPCHIGSRTAVSFYNFSDEMQAVADKVMAENPLIVKGDAWYAGDHAPFLFRGVPCMAVTSSDFFAGALACTHTPRDTLATVDEKLVSPSAKYLVDVVAALGKALRHKDDER